MPNQKSRWRKIGKWIMILALIGGAAVAGGWWYKSRLAWEQAQQEKNKMSEQWNGRYGWYTSPYGSYKIAIPEFWDVYDASQSATTYAIRTVFLPSQENGPIGNADEIAFTVVATPSAGQPQSTQEEYDAWNKRVKGTIVEGIELIETDQDNGRGVVLADRSYEYNGEKLWTILGWIRLNNLNLYVTMMGPKAFGDTEMGAFTKIFQSLETL